MTESSATIVETRAATLSLAGIWGILGVAALLGNAAWRLTPIALEPIVEGVLTPAQWLVYIGWVVFNAYAEGYRAFFKRFAPRVVSRAVHLSRQPKPLYALLAPVFCMAFIHATPRARVMAWLTVVFILLAVAVVQQLPQPWRGIIDGGVVVGLMMGVLALVFFGIQALRGVESGASAELPAVNAARS